jgi:hypothetical protein
MLRRLLTVSYHLRRAEIMKRMLTALTTAMLTLGTVSTLMAQECHNIDVRGDQALGSVANEQPGGCSTQVKNGFPVPDVNCTPGAFNPTVTFAVLQDYPNYRTRCNRDLATTAEEKFVTYSWYQLNHPGDNEGENQVSELDHLVPLELGGADTLDNIWPQCGPDGTELRERYFKLKDKVELYLAAMVKAEKIDLDQARRGLPVIGHNT